MVCWVHNKKGLIDELRVCRMKRERMSMLVKYIHASHQWVSPFLLLVLFARRIDLASEWVRFAGRQLIIAWLTRHTYAWCLRYSLFDHKNMHLFTVNTNARVWEKNIDEHSRSDDLLSHVLWKWKADGVIVWHQTKRSEHIAQVCVDRTCCRMTTEKRNHSFV